MDVKKLTGIVACVALSIAIVGAQRKPTATRASTPAPTKGPAPVRVELGTMTLPTYEEGPPDVNPSFDVFATRFTYPYTVRQNLTDRRAPQAWRTVVLENEYLTCTILPDLGGHLYNCVDRRNGANLFYANPSIKKANVAYRGAWTALGVEFNFPVSHSWVTVSPVDFATVRHADGSASVFVGDIDRVYGGQWRVELRLRPGRAVLEQHTTLYNRGERRHRFFWWTNAAVEVWDDSRLFYPQTFTESHGFTDIDTWPINRAGVDLTVVGNHKYGPVSQFSHGSREPFMGVYHPRTKAGVVHYSSPLDLPSKKFWSWSSDADGLDWRRALSDNNSAYVEIQAGLFRNQETFAFLEPQAVLQFSEYWLPVREIGGITRATPDAVLNLTRDGIHTLRAGLNVTRELPGARVTVTCATAPKTSGPKTLQLDLTPRAAWTYAFTPTSADPCRFDLQDRDGQVILTHTEGRYDLVPADRVKVGPQEIPAVPPVDRRTDADWLELGTRQELDGKLLIAWETYRRGLAAYPASAALQKASGRLAVNVKREPDAIEPLTKALARTSNDSELHYYLGLAQLATGDTAMARRHLELAQQFEPFRTPARFELARLLARERAYDEALALLHTTGDDAPTASRVGAAEIALLIRLGRKDEARARWQYWSAIDPTSVWLRYEGVQLERRHGAFASGRASGARGARDGLPRVSDPFAAEHRDLLAHLAGDADRVIGVAVDYMALGLWESARGVLATTYPEGKDVIAEPGVPHPSRHPLVAYYRGYCKRQLGESGDADYQLASSLLTTYVFPNRHETMTVLRDALKAQPGDATAHHLLGALYLSGGMVTDAVREWEEVRRTRQQTPGVHRNLGLTLLQALDKPDEAVAVLTEGLSNDASNLDLYLTLDQALSLTAATPDVRATALQRYPSIETAPGALVFKLAIALAEAGRFDDADRLFANRFFPREELGTNVRQVYLQVRLLRARAAAAAAADAGRCADALAVLDRIGAPVAGMAFTNDGLTPFLDTPRLQYDMGLVAASCNDRERATRHFTRASSSRTNNPIELTFAHRAAVALGNADVNAWTTRLRQALRDARTRAEAVGAGVPGALSLGQALLMQELGEATDARALVKEALRAPDRSLSHHLARQASAAR